MLDEIKRATIAVENSVEVAPPLVARLSTAAIVVILLNNAVSKMRLWLAGPLLS